MGGMTYILITAEKVREDGDEEDDIVTDYEVFDQIDFDKAQAAYGKASSDKNTYSATLAAVIDSTDYDTHPQMRLHSRG